MLLRTIVFIFLFTCFHFQARACDKIPYLVKDKLIELGVVSSSVVLKSDFECNLILRDGCFFIINNIDIKNNLASIVMNCSDAEDIKFDYQYKLVYLIPVFNRTLQRDSIITANDIHYIELNYIKYSDHILTNIEDIIGKKVRVDIKPNVPVLDYQLKQDIIVKRNQQLTAIYEKGDLVLRLKVISLDKGGIGDNINVKNIRSNAVMNAIIQDSITVVIQ